jgi:hypothetical protein
MKNWLTQLPSALPHHLPTATWGRPEPSNAAHLHSRAAVDAGTHNQVRSAVTSLPRKTVLTVR